MMCGFNIFWELAFCTKFLQVSMTVEDVFVQTTFAENWLLESCGI